ncbi:protein phosphatase 1 regulatory subunit 12A-like [Crotalus adamanteus]|uniref:Protein phosphatase 1 regulatory subunit 12A-like n=1 Tax=Crotalus adamanteus TaxID=8729 RepID=A0AAW1BDE8_CROAD
MKMADAKQKRNEQLKRWIGSETDQEPPVVKRKKTKVKFDDSAVFLAACSSGDTEEVLRLLERGADINYANVDGFAALHQDSLARALPEPLAFGRLEEGCGPSASEPSFLPPSPDF